MAKQKFNAPEGVSVGSQGIGVIDAGGNITSPTVTATNLVGRVATASQPSITSLGNLTELNVTGDITADTVSASTVSATDIQGTLVTSSQPNITSLGNLVSLTVTGTFTAGDIAGDASSLNNLNAGNLSTGTVPVDRLSGSYNINVTGSSQSATVAGTVLQNAQPNINSLGPLNNLTVYNSIQAAAVTYTGNDGSAGQVLTTNGSGGTYWTTPSSGGSQSPNMVVFSSPGTYSWSVPAGVSRIKVQLTGAGGSGGSPATVGNCAGGGGAGGGYVQAIVDVGGTTQFSITVGAKGQVARSAGKGGSGNNSSMSRSLPNSELLFTSYGGEGGFGANNISMNIGGQGGGGYINGTVVQSYTTRGSSGAPGIVMENIYGLGGAGGSSVTGSGGRGASNFQGGPAYDGSAGGGGGGGYYVSGGQMDAGPGGDGLCIIEW